MNDPGLVTTEQWKQAYFATLTGYNRVVDYIDSPQLVADLDHAWRYQATNALPDDLDFPRAAAEKAATKIRDVIGEQPTPDGWRVLPDLEGMAPPEITCGPIWLATSHDDVHPGYYDTHSHIPTVWDRGRDINGVFKWWKPMTLDAPTISVTPTRPVADRLKGDGSDADQER